MKEIQKEEGQEESLNLYDLLVETDVSGLSDYLSLSIENLGEDTRVTVTTVEDAPVTYSSMLSGVSISDLQHVVDVGVDPIA
ncbi:MAG: hypothetical protein KAG19_08695 [Methylococcales bacterium]|nr:hypothetical protein [Methylococcales bacterium]